MTKRRTAILISGTGSNMQALVKAAEAEDYPAEIALVFSNNPQAPGLEFARQHQIAAMGEDHRLAASRQAFDKKLTQTLIEHDISLIACAGYMRILSDEFVETWMGRLINIHPSLLPAYRGTDTHQRVLADGGKRHGCTVHYVIPELDAGPVIAQSEIAVLADDTAETLRARVLAKEHLLYPKALACVASGRARLEQGEVIFTDAPSENSA